MCNSISTYLADLKSMLDGAMPDERVAAIVMEAETHLCESVRRKVSTTVDEATAAEFAIASYGKPDKVALAFLRGARRKMLGLRPAWWGCIGALLAIGSWNYFLLTLQGYFDTFGSRLHNEMAGWIGLVGLIILAMAARTGYRSHWLQLIGLTAAVAVMSIPLMSAWMIPSTASPQWSFQQGISRLHLSRDLPKVRQSIAFLDNYQEIYKRGIREYATAKSPADLSSEMSNATVLAARLGIRGREGEYRGLSIVAGTPFVVPRDNGASAEVNGRVWALETVGTFDEAKRQWAKRGGQGLNEVRFVLTGLRSIEHNAAQAMAGRLFFFQQDLYLETVFFTMSLLPLFLLIDGIAAWAARPKRRTRTRAIAS